MPSRFTPPVLERLLAALIEIRDQCLALERTFQAEIDAVAPLYRNSARNLLHYLALRQHDLRDLQRDLSALGLSSLGRHEAHTLAGLDAVMAALHKLSGTPMVRSAEAVPPVDFASGPALLASHTREMLGPSARDHAVRIMVTAPSEAAGDYDLVRELMLAGMDILRINCAHDDVAAWDGMVTHVRRAERELGRSCRILMDLGGPKLRTGPVEGGGHVARWVPRRNLRGGLEEPAVIYLAPAGSPAPAPADADLVMPVDAETFRALRVGDGIVFTDLRKRRRRIDVMAAADGLARATANESAVIETGMAIQVRRGRRSVIQGTIGPLPRIDEPIILRPGDTLFVGSPEVRGVPARGGHPAQIGCTLPDVFAFLQPGQRVFFDDGKIGGVIRATAPDGFTVEITQASRRGSRLRSDKGINLPDTHLDLPALSSKDLADLDFAAAHADMVGLSFVRQPADILRLEEELDKRGGSRLGILVKIENREAFENLPRLLLVGLQSPPLGVMVARGDLGVELGFERLAEVQEEILWLCEAAHVPVIWATQVLEGLAKKGRPSRAEVTDAAMSGRAECVMLNKGPHAVEAVRFLHNVLDRMQLHQQKKRSMLRQLAVSKMPVPESAA